MKLTDVLPSGADSPARKTFFQKVLIRYAIRRNTLYCRITVDRIRCKNDFSINERVKRPKNPQRVADGEWDTKRQRIKGSGPEAIVINARLDSITAQLKAIGLELSNRGVHYTAETIKRIFVGEEKLTYSFIDASQKHIDYLRALPQDEIAPATTRSYLTRHNNMVEFLKAKGLSGITCEEFSPTIARQFIQYMRVERVPTVSTSYAGKNLEMARKVIKFAINQEWIKFNPLQAFVIKKGKHRMPPYLSEEELTVLTMRVFDIDRLQKIKDCFLFACHTGLSYKDIKAFAASKHLILANGVNWIEMSRIKTGIDFYVPLSAVAMAILKRYGGEQLPVPSNVKFNAYLKEIQHLCRIQTGLTVKVARTTFGVVMLNDMNQDLETVSKMLGHASTKITERHYTQVLKRKIVRNLVTNNPTLYESL